ncbi:TNT domain-containing protein [Actinomadura terrae]|uniref:TNT domain-containing protein n=1 Tax=Actinomadura terrae TaxID=604353 RepID=UPI001FA720F2|nr:TNT domain-containing protein [Actinomadura terrae]
MAVRRRRLRDALLFGPQRTRRTFDENVGKILAGLCVAAVLCAGTVGWSFLRSRLDEQERAKAQEALAPAGGTAPVPADWVGTQVNFGQLRAALGTAGVPSTLYVLPGQARPAASRTSSYYMIARSKDGFTGGIVEYEQGTVAAEFPTEDEASRWLYGELALKETPPHVLTPQTEPDAVRQGGALATDARAKINMGGGAAVTYLLTQGRFVDQFGQESGSLLFPFGMPFAQRGLPPAARTGTIPGVPSNYLRYRVVRPFQVAASLSAPTARSPGGGIRFTVNAGLFPRPPALPTIRWLLRSGYLERVSGTAIPR